MNTVVWITGRARVSNEPPQRLWLAVDTKFSPQCPTHLAATHPIAKLCNP